MKVINVTTGQHFDFPSYATMMGLWFRVGNRLWRGFARRLGDGWIVADGPLD